MKKAAVLLLGLFCMASCGDGAEKPERLLSEDEMANILYDITVLQAMRAHQPKYLLDNNVSTTDYIYQKYKIDSATFAQNNTYYASDLDKYDRIHKKVTDRVNKEKAAFEDKKDTLKTELNKQLGPNAMKKMGLENQEKAEGEAQ
ncbi:DUF4296 domain-containing protein [Flavobacterium sp. D11R37]|uniref:DUF4296 domain-containing protein n=1 Tax=Flavobacterium coralii TaxID=2838017 RepID=UPI001CA5FB9B|nr:DUF4296 domain-containing protein [Flavobacterium coralii]MBY8962916.1 DUF4296 domain-containing protein [Flavobacterium coralii]